VIHKNLSFVAVLLVISAGQQALADDSLRLMRAPSTGVSTQSSAPTLPSAPGEEKSPDQTNTAQESKSMSGSSIPAVSQPKTDNAHTDARAENQSSQSATPEQNLGSDKDSVATFKVQIPARPSGIDARELTVEDRALLSKHDVVLVIDKSGSMSTCDCPEKGNSKLLSAGLMLAFGYRAGCISRWDWCFRQVLALGNETDDLFPNGITVIVFSDGFTIYKGVHLKQIPMVFANNRPSGGTRMAEPLNAAFADYFHRKALDPHVKPLVVAIITDGMPNYPEQVDATIAYATNHMQNSSELALTMLQIGPSCMGYAMHLANDTQRFGARFNIVHTKTFLQLEKAGLARSLIDALTERERF